MPVETVRQVEAGFWELLEAFQSVSLELARFKDVARVAEAASKLALDLTKSSLAFIILTDESRDHNRIFSSTADPEHVLDASDIELLVASAATQSRPGASGLRS